MLRIATFIEKFKNKYYYWYNKRLFKEKTGQDVSTTRFMGKVEIRNK